MVSGSKHRSVAQVGERTKPLLTWVTPKHEWECASPGTSRESRVFPKRKFRSIPSIRAVSWHRVHNIIFREEK